MESGEKEEFRKKNQPAQRHHHMSLPGRYTLCVNNSLCQSCQLGRFADKNDQTFPLIPFQRTTPGALPPALEPAAWLEPWGLTGLGGRTPPSARAPSNAGT